MDKTELTIHVLYCGEGNGTHSSTLAWKIPWTEEPGRLQSMRSQRVGHVSDFTFTFHFYALEKEMATHSRVESQGWGRTGSDTTEVT